MKVKVTRKFRDKYTGELHAKGDCLEITEERYAEIMSAGDFVYQIAQMPAETVETIDATNPSSEEQTAAETPSDDFESMSIRELKEYADKAYKLTFKNGTKKAEIIDTLRRKEQGSK